MHHAVTPQAARAARPSMKPALPASRSRLVHDWILRVLREEPRDEVLAMVDWLAVRGGPAYLGALVAAGCRFPDDAEVAAAIRRAAEAYVGR